jgi:hypothetical protein
MNAFGRKGSGDFSNAPLLQRVQDSPAGQAARMLEELDRELHPKLGRLIVPSYNQMSKLMRKMG